MMHRVSATAAALLLAGCATVDLNAPAPVADRSATAVPPSSYPASLPPASGADTGVIVHEVSIANPTIRPMDPYPGDLARNGGVPDTRAVSSGSSSGVQEEQSGTAPRVSNGGTAAPGSASAGEVTPDGVLLLPPKAVPGR